MQTRTFEKKSLGKTITARYGLNMIEMVGTFTGKKIGSPVFRGSKPIDAVWATPDIVVVVECVMPTVYGVGDHRLFILYFLTPSMIGQTPSRIIRSGARRLNKKIPSTKYNYTNVMEKLVLIHHLTERMVAAHHESSSIVLVKERIDIIYQKGVQYTFL